MGIKFILTDTGWLNVDRIVRIEHSYKRGEKSRVIYDYKDLFK